MNEKSKKLQSEKEITIRFSEVDSARIVWHGSYLLYLEDAREWFGKQYHLEYMYMYKMGFLAPLVDVKVQYKHPLHYGDRAKVVITYRNTLAAKLIFDYEIYNIDTGELAVTATTIQVFMDLNNQLVWTTPDFIEQWKANNGLI